MNNRRCYYYYYNLLNLVLASHYILILLGYSLIAFNIVMLPSLISMLQGDVTHFSIFRMLDDLHEDDDDPSVTVDESQKLLH